MSFPQDVKERVLVSSGRCCAICHNFKGNNIEIHHIKKHSEGGADTFENAIPLCFDCHAEVGQYDPKHPKGTKFTEQELKMHRDAWYEKVKKSGGVVSNPDTVDNDISIYNKLKELIPYDLLEYLCSIDFYGGSFQMNVFDPIEKFTYVCKNPLYEYFDPDIEIQKQKLCSAIKKFFEDSFACIFCFDKNICRIPLDWEYDDSKGYQKYADRLNTDTQKIWEDYCTYIRMCRRKLNITGE